MRYKWIIYSMVIACFTGCSLGPEHTPPEKNLPGAWKEDSLPAASKGIRLLNEKPIIQWWHTLNDPILVKFIERSVTHNFDLRIAVTRVREARALRKVQASGFYPRVDAFFNQARLKGSENAFGPNPKLAAAGLGDLEGNMFQAGFDASWEIDFFGGTHKKVEAADAHLAAAFENQRNVLLTIMGEVAINYLQLRGNQRRLAVAKNNIRIQEETLLFTENRHLAGLGNELAVLQARSQLRATKSIVPMLNGAIRSGAYQLAVLTDQFPGEALAELNTSHPLPLPPKLIPVGLPSDLLLRRPDLRYAEQQLVAANAQIGMARADLFPRFFLTGTGGMDSTSTSSLFDWASRTWSFGPSIRWPIFHGGRIRANIEASQARKDVALYRYEQAIIAALTEVESGLAGYVAAQGEQQNLSKSVHASRQVLVLAQTLYKKGLTDFLTVLDAQGRLNILEDRLVISEIAMVTHLIHIYKALGGGWEIYEPKIHLSTVAPISNN